MPKAIFNIAYTNATPPANYSGNRRADYIARRNFYNLTAEYNYFSYSLNGKKVVKNATAEGYFTREGTNTGLFNMQGLISEAQKEELKAALKETKSPIWHGFISFDAETSLGFQTQENAIKFMNQTFGGFLRRAGFQKDNVELFCSLHEDTDNRHIHFAFFEKEPLHTNSRGDIGVYHRGLIANKVIDNYLVSANMHLSENGEQYYSARDKAMDELKRIRSERAETGRFRTGRVSENLKLSHAFQELIAKLPKTGRLQYNADSMEKLRPEIDALAERLIQSDPRARAAYIEMQKQFARVEKETVQIALENKLAYSKSMRMSKEQIQAAMGGNTINQNMPLQYLDMKNVDYLSRLQDDFKARLGNMVLGVCKDMMKEQKRTEWNRKTIAKNSRRKRSRLLWNLKKAIIAECTMDSANFLKTVKEHEYEIKREEEANRISG